VLRIKKDHIEKTPENIGKALEKAYGKKIDIDAFNL
jgi:hypothetical protein